MSTFLVELSDYVFISNLPTEKSKSTWLFNGLFLLFCICLITVHSCNKMYTHIPLQVCYRSPHFQHTGIVPAVWREWWIWLRWTTVYVYTTPGPGRPTTHGNGPRCVKAAHSGLRTAIRKKQGLYVQYCTYIYFKPSDYLDINNKTISDFSRDNWSSFST